MKNLFLIVLITISTNALAGTAEDLGIYRDGYDCKAFSERYGVFGARNTSCYRLPKIDCEIAKNASKKGLTPEEASEIVRETGTWDARSCRLKDKKNSIAELKKQYNFFVAELEQRATAKFEKNEQERLENRATKKQNNLNNLKTLFPNDDVTTATVASGYVMKVGEIGEIELGTIKILQKIEEKYLAIVDGNEIAIFDFKTTSFRKTGYAPNLKLYLQRNADVTYITSRGFEAKALSFTEVKPTITSK